MKNLLNFLFLTVLLFSSCQEELSPDSVPTLSQNELETLLFTREEEKLAHDVYSYAFEKYGLAIFQNIANSESQHTASILALMDTYQIYDPLYGNDSQGYFLDPAIKELYVQLTSRVDLSLEEAIKVGLLIEDLDINDLEMGIAETSHGDITNVYSRLKCGSENHLRSFNSQAKAMGITYSPDYISQAYFDSIVNSPRTSCQPS